jgi:hypothetical protein
LSYNFIKLEKVEPLSFKITDEETIQLNTGKLFVIQTNDCGKHFGVEVTNSTRGFGRSNTPSFETSKEVFDLVVKRMRKFNDFETACSFAKNLFSLKRMFLIRFVLQAENVILSQAEIGKMRRKVGFDVVAKNNYAGNEQRPGWITIKAIKNNETVGEFVGKRFSGDFRFTADNNINVDFLKEIVNFA